MLVPPSSSRPFLGSERRRHPRVEVLASLEIRSFTGSAVLPVQDLSLGGALVAAAGDDLPGVTTCEAALLDWDGGSRVELAARMVRRAPGSMAIAWQATGDAVAAVQRLLDKRIV